MIQMRETSPCVLLMAKPTPGAKRLPLSSPQHSKNASSPPPAGRPPRPVCRVAVMSRPRRSFPPALHSLRAMTVQETLDRLGLYWKRDPDFVPVKDAATVRLNVSIGGGGVELLATWPKWYDTRKEQGGGAIDLTMHLFRLSFVDAVKRLSP